MKKAAIVVAMILSVFSAFPNDEIAEAEKYVREHKCKNLAVNGAFELFGKKNQIPHWWPWKNEKSQGEANWGQNSGVKDSGAAVLTGGQILISQDINKVKPGEKYLIKVMVKKNTEAGKASLAIRTKIKHKWNLNVKTVSIPAKLSETNKWESVASVISVQPGVDALCIMLNASDLNGEDSEIIFDNVEVYKIKVPEK